jgi:hypothetical protein
MIRQQVREIIQESKEQYMAETYGILTESQINLMENAAQRIQRAGIDAVKIEIFRKGRESYVFTEFVNKFEFLHQNGEDLVEKSEIDRQTFLQMKRDVRGEGFKLLKDGEKKNYFRSITGFIKKNYLKIGIGSVILVAIIIDGVRSGAPYMSVMPFLRTIPYIGKMADEAMPDDDDMVAEQDLATDVSPTIEEDNEKIEPLDENLGTHGSMKIKTFNVYHTRKTRFIDDVKSAIRGVKVKSGRKNKEGNVEVTVEVQDIADMQKTITIFNKFKI